VRLELSPELETRNGVANKDARLTNTLSETENGVSVACIRPALEAVATASGNGNGLVNFQGTLISVFGATLGHGTTPSTITTVVNGKYEFAQSPL
jgi:hypothetical protein